LNRTVGTALVTLAVSMLLLSWLASSPPVKAAPDANTAESGASVVPTDSASGTVAVETDVPALEIAPDPAYATTSPKPYSWVDQRWIAHGMGGVERHRVTDSLEAFKHNYERGYRVFEVDLIPATDGRLVARHDWEGYLYEFLGQKVDNPYRRMSTAEFKALKIHDSYTPLTVDDVVALMKAYPDIWVMTDTKGTTSEEARASFEDIMRAVGSDTILADRLIVQIYNEDMLSTVQAVHRFKNLVYTLYQADSTPERAVEFAENNDIKVVAIPTTMWSEEFVSRVRRDGGSVAVYTTNDAGVAKKFRESGVALIYSDFLAPVGSAK